MSLWLSICHFPLPQRKQNSLWGSCPWISDFKPVSHDIKEPKHCPICTQAQSWEPAWLYSGQAILSGVPVNEPSVGHLSKGRGVLWRGTQPHLTWTSVWGKGLLLLSRTHDYNWWDSLPARRSVGSGLWPHPPTAGEHVVGTLNTDQHQGHLLYSHICYPLIFFPTCFGIFLYCMYFCMSCQILFFNKTGYQ